MKKITFFSTIPGVNDVAPVVEAGSMLPKWVETARNDYKKQLEQAGDSTFFHIYRCPGIFDLFNTGYILRAWCDFTIETDVNQPYGFKWSLPNTDIVDIFREAEHGSIISNHGGETGSAGQIPYPNQSVKTIIKYGMPWHAIVPKGLKFIMMPLPYSDDQTFSSSVGIWDPSISTNCNIQMFWHKLDGSHTVRTGTPLAQLIPISAESFKFETRDATDHDIKWTKKKHFLLNFGFMFRRNQMKESYENHFPEKKCPFHKYFK